MNPVVIMSDSTCDLSKDIIREKNIAILPLYVNFNDSIYRDGVDINTHELYKKVDELGRLPKTSAPSIGDFIEFYRPFIESGHDIVYVGISSKLSATNQNARLATQEYPEGRIHVVDSLNLSTGIGLLALKATSYRDQGLSAEKIALEVETLVSKVKTAFVIDTFEYLHKGGRCSSLTSLVGTMLKIKPIIHVVDGGMIVGQKPRGIKKGYRLMLDQIFNDKEKLDPEFVMVTHSEADEAAEYLKSEMESNLTINTLYTTEAGCVISSHCGRGTIGILYITKE